ncbi:MAG: hypothetical protein IPM32_18215 [Ignavibacteriae bacterium]|nr:hypothetical protein [Ignavibacteriota bacterium]
MKFPELLKEEVEKQNSPLENRFRELLEIENPTGPELKELIMSDLALRIKTNRKQIKNLTSEPYATSALIETKKFNDVRINDLQIEIKLELENLIPEERKLFYPSLANKDFSAYELQLQSVNEIYKSVEQNKFNGINKVYDDLERAIEIGRIDFATLLIEKLEKFLKENSRLDSQPYQRFLQIQNDFLNLNKRGEIRKKIEDLKAGKKIIEEHLLKFS